MGITTPGLSVFSLPCCRDPESPQPNQSWRMIIGLAEPLLPNLGITPSPGNCDGLLKRKPGKSHDTGKDAERPSGAMVFKKSLFHQSNTEGEMKKSSSFDQIRQWETERICFSVRASWLWRIYREVLHLT
jgi:hypothetical protein